MALSEELHAILVCPACHARLTWRPEAQQLACEACRLLFRVENDIPVMLLDEAEPY